MHIRRRTALLLAMTLTLAVWPATGGHAKLPMIGDDMAGDPGDGVLRPAEATVTTPTTDVETIGSSATTDAPAPVRLSGPFILVPYFAAPGQPWSLSFRLVRVESSTSYVGRWHRAP
jgi:hypothetical protein